MTTLLDGKAVAAAIREEVAAGVAELLAAGGRPPGLAAVLVGEDPASQLYVASKARDCEEVGMLSRVHHLHAEVEEEELLALVDALDADPAIDGILVQLPLPPQISEPQGARPHPAGQGRRRLPPVNVGRLWLDEPGFLLGHAGRRHGAAAPLRGAARRRARRGARAAAPSSASRWPGCCCARTAR